MVLRQCATCGRQFTKTEHFKRHERSHTRERPYSCSVCDKAFSRSDVLFRHMKSHSQRGENSTNSSFSKRRGTAPESSASQLPQENYQIQPNNSASTSQNGIPLGQILSPSNYIAPPEQNLESGTHHGSVDVPGSYIATPINYPLHSVDMQMINDWRTQSQIPNTHQGPLPMHIPRHTSQPQHSVSTYDGRISQSQQFVPNLGSDVGSAQFPNPEMQWPQHHNAMGQGGYSDPYQMWLFPSLEDLEQSPDFLQAYGSISDETITVSDAKAPSNGRNLLSTDANKTINKVPKERFARVQRYWAPKPHKEHRLMPVLWKEIISTPMKSLFYEETNSHPDAKGTSSWGLDAECMLRLRSTFRTPMSSTHHSPHENPALDPLITNNPDTSDFPPAEILDIALGHFFRKIHPMIPLIHLPTFSVKNTPAPLLFTLCLLGLSILGTTGATRFVYKMFPVVLHRISSDAGMCAANQADAGIQLNIFATGMLGLGLFATMGDKDCYAQSQMLYASILSMAQRQGLFSINEGPQPDTVLAGMTDSEQHWIAWCKIETAKRLILGLLLVDSWTAHLTSRPPTIRSEDVCIAAPCDETLYQARSAAEWQSIIQAGKQMNSRRISLNTVHLLKPDCKPALGYLEKCCWLALLQIQALESYHRLIPNSRQKPTSHIPWRTYAKDETAKHLVSAVLVSCQNLGPASLFKDRNCTVLWHSLCIMLLADFHIFELAAGRHGPGPASDAMNEITRWSQTIEARRACVHAAQIFKLMSDRKISDNLNIHSAAALFASALILGMYLFMVPSTNPEHGLNINQSPVELVDVEVDWLALNDLGFTEVASQTGSRKSSENKLNQVTSNPEQPQTRPPQATTSAIHQFIQYSGPITVLGVPLAGGYESARRVLLDFATVMDTLSGRRLRNYTQVLHIMADDLTNVDSL